MTPRLWRASASFGSASAASRDASRAPPRSFALNFSLPRANAMAASSVVFVPAATPVPTLPPSPLPPPPPPPVLDVVVQEPAVSAAHALTSRMTRFIRDFIGHLHRRARR